MRKLMVHSSKRYLCYEDGEPFFYLADTAWSLFSRLTREETDYYLSVRAQQGFNTIQAACLFGDNRLRRPNVYGRFALKQIGDVYDPEQPDLDGEYSYWDHVDYGIKTAAEKGLFVAFLPTWGDKYNQKLGGGPEIFTEQNAYSYGKWLAQRYGGQWNIIWMLGGDRALENDTHRAIIDAMGRGIRENDAGEHLITFHTPVSTSSADFLAGKDYIDFHTVQSGHEVEVYRSWGLVRRTGEAEEKPFMDAEPRYEDHPACFKSAFGYSWNHDDVRQNTYWNLMEGVCGNTYGNSCIWGFTTTPNDYFMYRWQDAIHHTGAQQAKFAKQLRLSRPYFEFRHAPELVADDTADMAHQAAGRGEDYAFIYTPQGLPIRAFLDKLDGQRPIRASWFDPRTGKEEIFGVFAPRETLFVPPSRGKGCDWVLILDVQTL